MYRTLYWIIVALWGGIMIGLSITVGLFVAPPASGPTQFLGMIAGGTVLNMTLSAFVAAIPLLIRRWREQTISPIRVLSYYSIAWILVTFVQLVGFAALLETTRATT